MIYITFFIVILIDKRGVREALRERDREKTERKGTTAQYTQYTGTHTTAERERERRKRYTTTPPPREKGIAEKEV